MLSFSTNTRHQSRQVYERLLNYLALWILFIFVDHKRTTTRHHWNSSILDVVSRPLEHAFFEVTDNRFVWTLQNFLRGYAARTQSLHESCAIAKMTAQCLHATYTWMPWNFRDSLTTPIATIPNIFYGLLFRSKLWMFVQNLKSVALPVPEIIGGTLKIWALPGYAHAPFSPKFLMGFYSDWPCKCTRQIWSL